MAKARLERYDGMREVAILCAQASLAGVCRSGLSLLLFFREGVCSTGVL